MFVEVKPKLILMNPVFVVIDCQVIIFLRAR